MSTSSSKSQLLLELELFKDEQWKYKALRLNKCVALIKFAISAISSISAAVITVMEALL